jgi:cytochrome b pre-mRNA-processing protein 3
MIRILQQSSIIYRRSCRSIVASSLVSTQSNQYSSKPDKDPMDPALTQNLHLPAIVKPGLFTRFAEAMGYQGSYRYSQKTMTVSGIRLYLCIQKQIDYDKFFKLCEARDVFVSFSLITYLHVWMISVRLAQEGRSGEYVKQQLVQAMWDDIAKRINVLATLKTKTKRESYEKLNNIFRAALFGYDEGILSDDCILAAAIWRHLLEMRDIGDLRVLTRLCEYVRKNVKHLDGIQENEIMVHGIATFIDFDKDSVDHFKERKKILDYFSQNLLE